MITYVLHDPLHDVGVYTSSPILLSRLKNQYGLIHTLTLRGYDIVGHINMGYTGRAWIKKYKEEYDEEFMLSLQA